MGSVLILIKTRLIQYKNDAIYAREFYRTPLLSCAFHCIISTIYMYTPKEGSNSANQIFYKYFDIYLKKEKNDNILIRC